MATKKVKPAAASVDKAAATQAMERADTQPAVLAAQDADNGQRWLREAAWSRMFGRNETKNPFAR